MITLNVFFEEYDPNYSEGTATLYENLITDDVKLVLNNHLVISEFQHFINEAVNSLKLRYDEVKVNIHYETANKKESETYVITSK